MEREGTTRGRGLERNPLPLPVRQGAPVVTTLLGHRTAAGHHCLASLASARRRLYAPGPAHCFCRPLIGRRRGQRHSTPPFCEMWIGISAAENAPLQAFARGLGQVTNRYHCASWK
jgi:hypothetical protein